MELYMLRLLSAFAEFKTLSKTAEELNTSQPAVSRAMQKLEDEIDVPLFDRSKNKIALNRFGQTAARYAGEICAACEKMTEEVRAEWKASLVFSYGSIASFPILELNPIIGQLYMGTEIRSVLEETETPLVEGLENGTFRLIILRNPLEGEKFYCQKLFRETLKVLLPKNHRLADRKSISLSELAGENILIHDKIGFWYPLCKEKIPGAKFLVQQELSTLREIVKSSELISFMTNVSYRNTEVPPNKVAVALENPETDVTFWCVALAENRRRLEALFSQVKTFSKMYE